MIVLAIDPGNELSAYLLYDASCSGVLNHDKVDNEALLNMLQSKAESTGFAYVDHLAIEMVASYGMPVGREVFDTCVWIGRFIEAWGTNYTRVYRSDVKSHLCHHSRAKDANIRAALLDRFGPGKDKAVGTKRAPGPLYGVSGDVWAALAVAVTYVDGAATRDARIQLSKRTDEQASLEDV